MNETAYVLMQENSILGVFDSPEIPKEQLKSYFAGDFEILRFNDIDDSGIKWQLSIKTIHDGVQNLTMMYFGVNEIE